MIRICLVCLALGALSLGARADSVAEINAKSLKALVYLGEQAKGIDAFLQDAAGVLVFPDIVKLGFGAGGQYGEGVLLVDQKPDAYYSTAGAAFGLQLGAQFKSEVIVFVTEQALVEFRQRRGFEVGIDGQVALLTAEEAASLSSAEIDEPIVGFIFSNEGVLANLTMEGAKMTKLAR
ncbi:MAG: YSC84-related protein [Halioglobus sp.]